MANAFASLVVEMGVNLARFRSEMGQAASISNSKLNDIGRSVEGTKKQFDSLGTVARRAMGALGIGLSAREIIQFSQSIAEAADKVNLLSIRLQTFSGDSNAFNKAYQAAQQLGVSVEDTADSMTQLLVVGQQFGLTANKARDLYVTYAQLGRVGGASADSMSRAMTQLVQGMGKGKVELQDLKIVMSEVPLVAKAIADELGIAVGALAEAAGQGRITTDVIIKGLGNAAKFAADEFAKLPDTLEQQKIRMSNAWTGLLAAMDSALRQSDLWQFFYSGLTKTLEDLRVSIGGTGIQAITADLKAAEAALADLEARQKALNDPGRWLIFSGEGPLFGFLDKDLSEQIKIQQDLIAKLKALKAEYEAGAISQEKYLERQAQIAAEATLAAQALAAQKEAAEELAKAREKDLAAINSRGESVMASLLSESERITAQFWQEYAALEAMKVTMKDVAGAVEWLTELQARLAATRQQEIDDLSRGEEKVKDLTAAIERYKSAIEFSLTPQQKLMADIEKLNKLFIESGYFDPEGFRIAVEKMVEESGKAADTMTVFMEQAARNMQTALAQYLFNPAAEGFRGMLAGFVDMIRRMVAELLAQQILLSFFNWLGGFGGVVGSIGKSLGEGIKPRAQGGPVMPGGTYLVGERGPELLTMGANKGMVSPLGSTAGGGVQISYSIDARGADADRIMAILPGMMKRTEERTIAHVRELIARGRLA